MAVPVGSVLSSLKMESVGGGTTGGSGGTGRIGVIGVIGVIGGAGGRIVPPGKGGVIGIERPVSVGGGACANCGVRKSGLGES